MRCCSVFIHCQRVLAGCWLVMTFTGPVLAQAPLLESVFPAGGEAGQGVEVRVQGANLAGVSLLQTSVAGVTCEPVKGGGFRLVIPADAPAGPCDAWVVGPKGISAPRTFVIGRRPEVREVEGEDLQSVPLGCVVNGRVDKAADVDRYAFQAEQGQQVVIDCVAERLDSRLRGVLEVLDSHGQRLAVNRGFWGVDPLIAFRVPETGTYTVRIQDLTGATNRDQYLYRLEIDAGPRVAFAVPNVIERNEPARVTLFGWNLADRSRDPGGYDRQEIEIPAAEARDFWPLPRRLRGHQSSLAAAARPVTVAGCDEPVLVGVTDVPVVVDGHDNHSAATAREVNVPCEISGQLAASEEADWYVVTVRQGEVLYLEAQGQRIDSPVDLQLSVVEPTGLRDVAVFNDEPRNLGGAFPTNHLDPVGRWVCPAEGRWLVVVRNLNGGLTDDPRRQYRLSLRREEPAFEVVAIPRVDNPSGLNVSRGGSEVLDLLAFRSRGCEGPIRIVAKDLPPGVVCPDVWLGPGVEKGTLVVRAEENAAEFVGELKLEAVIEPAGGTAAGSAIVRRPVRGGRIVVGATPLNTGRLMPTIPLAVVGQAAFRIAANAHEPVKHQLYGVLTVRHAPGGIVDVAVETTRSGPIHDAPVKVTCLGLPDGIAPQAAVIPAGQSRGFVSLVLPPTVPTGRYTVVLRAQTTVADNAAAVDFCPVTFDVEPAAFQVEVDPFTVTRVRRGEVLKVSYASKRLNGFIGKMHTELAVPGIITDVPGLRGRGETFTGQTETGSLQITVNDDAPLGRIPGLRLFTVGVVEDEPIYHGCSLLPLEVVE